MRLRALLFLLVALVPAAAQEPQGVDLGGALKLIDEEALRPHVKYLADDELEGRAAGFPGNEKAVEYLVKELKTYGLKPAGEGEGFTQEFTFRSSEGPRKAKNVIALWEGSDDKLKSEYVTIGAHLDHVGRVGQKVGGQSGGPRAGDEIWNGADDNASGTSALLAVARAFSKSGVRPRRSVLFFWWNAEEAGLIGSRHWTNSPTRPIEGVVFNLNLDMVGRNPDRPMDFEGVKNADGDTLEKMITAACEAEGLKITKHDFHHEAMFRSDGASFLRKGIPASMMFTSWHDDYHKVGDHADKIAYGNLTKISRSAFRILWGVGNLDRRLEFNPDHPLRGGKQLGVQGEAAGGGWRVKSVQAGSVAERAGIQAGDVIVGYGGKPLPGANVLRELQERVNSTPRGQEVEVEILRGEERKTLKAVWPKR